MEDDKKQRYSHSDLEFIVRDRGLNVTGDLLAAISDLNDSLEGSYASTEEAVQAVSKFATQAINKVPLSLAVLESRIQAIEMALGVDDSE